MYENLEEDPDELSADEYDFEKKGCEFQEIYQAMLKKYQYLLIKESKVR